MENLIIKEISRRAEQLIRYHAEQLLEAPIPLDKQPSMNDAAAVITSVAHYCALNNIDIGDMMDAAQKSYRVESIALNMFREITQ
ncbi:MAG: hypothetical protein LUQ26_05315 [Methylococcaceae bacterium]|nr:hypothetical protein [Methylococcaceae bacterium]